MPGHTRSIPAHTAGDPCWPSRDPLQDIPHTVQSKVQHSDQASNKTQTRTVQGAQDIP